MADYSWLDDIRDDEDNELGAVLTDPNTALKMLALLDFGYKGCDSSDIDAYAEEIFLVDTADARNPVLIWPHDGNPTQIDDDFDDFLANLREFRGDGDGEGVREDDNT